MRNASTPTRERHVATERTQVGTVEITDPHNVTEALVNGPFNILRTGAMVMFTFTVMRQDPAALFAGDKNSPSKGVVAARLLMPKQMAEELGRLIGQNLGAGSGRPD
jgi:hypothetical protein